MANRLLFLAYLLLVVIAGSSQTDGDRQRSDSMIKALKKSKSVNDRIDLLLNLAQYHILKQGELQVDFDSAAAYIGEVAALTSNNKTSAAYGYQLLTESALNREKGQRDLGKNKAEEAVRILEPLNNKDYLGKAYAELGMYYTNIQESRQSITRISLTEKSVGAFQQAGNLLQKAKNLELLGDLYHVIGNYDKALSALKAALVAYDSIQFTETQGVYVLMGTIYQRQQDYGQALHYVLKALRTAKQHNVRSMQLCQIYYMLGLQYRELDKTAESVKYLSEGLEVARKNKDGNAVCLMATGVANGYLEMQQPEQSLKVLNSIPADFIATAGFLEKIQIRQNFFRTYVALQQNDSAKLYYDTLLSIASHHNPALALDRIRSNIYALISGYHLNLKEYSKARNFLTKSDALAKEIKFSTLIIRNLRRWYMLDSAQGNFRTAFNYLNSYKTEMDLINSEKKVNQFQVLTVEYELGIKEDSIKLKDKDIALLKERNSLQQANLRAASLIKNVTIGGIVLAFVIISLLYRQYRLKQKSNQLVTKKNTQLQHYLDEKEWLLKEIHHRVKNNLQIVMSLLNSQSAFIESQPALTAIHDSQHRIHAMSLIHQKLYNTENLSSIDMSAYIRELVSYLSDSFSTGQRIHFEFAIAPLEMDVSQAVPLGLILNEAITNSIKYAFPGDRNGIISISLSNAADHQYLLIISDNGIGIPKGVTSRSNGSLGMSLMAGLSEDLDGHFSIENKNGTIIKIAFVHEFLASRQSTLTPALVSNN